MRQAAALRSSHLGMSACVLRAGAPSPPQPPPLLPVRPSQSGMRQWRKFRSATSSPVARPAAPLDWAGSATVPDVTDREVPPPVPGVPVTTSEVEATAGSSSSPPDGPSAGPSPTNPTPTPTSTTTSTASAPPAFSHTTPFPAASTSSTAQCSTSSAAQYPATPGTSPTLAAQEAALNAGLPWAWPPPTHALTAGAPLHQPGLPIMAVAAEAGAAAVACAVRAYVACLVTAGQELGAGAPTGVTTGGVQKKALGANPILPFTSIIGQDEMRLALLLCVVDPKIGGVMIMGERGTGKTTAVRALTALLPPLLVVAGDPCNCSPSDPALQTKEVAERVARGEVLPTAWVPTPLVELPLGATEDRVCGTLDLERALGEGVRAWEPGLLAKANRGILYVDEVNLLDDHLVDVLLDAAATGWNTVEREGVGVGHPSRFILVGSGNPEEGELRPQLLDRFGMGVAVITPRNPNTRVAIVRQRQAFDEDPVAYVEAAKPAQDALAARLMAARDLLPHVTITVELRASIARVCSKLKVDGIRGDIVATRAARALAALEGRDKVTVRDVGTALLPALRHRIARDPLARLSAADAEARVRDGVEEELGADALPPRPEEA